MKMLTASGADKSGTVAVACGYQYIFLIGKKTESGFTYRVYYMDVEIRKGQTARHYKFFVTVDETDIILIDAYHYKFKDGSGEEDYLEKYILPVVGSFDIVKN